LKINSCNPATLGIRESAKIELRFEREPAVNSKAIVKACPAKVVALERIMSKYKT